MNTVKDLYKDAKLLFDSGLTKLTMVEPPCKECKNFRPRIKTDNKGDFNGVVLCTTDKMFSDFSCYDAKE